MPLFYLCQTPEGPQLEPTQATAKVADPAFKKADLRNDKDGLRQDINELLRDAHNRAHFNAAEDRRVEALIEPLFRTATVPNGCPACNRTPVGAHKIAQGQTATELENIILGLDQDYLLNNIIEVAKVRLAELGEKA